MEKKQVLRSVRFRLDAETNLTGFSSSQNRRRAVPRSTKRSMTFSVEEEESTSTKTSLRWGISRCIEPRNWNNQKQKGKKTTTPEKEGRGGRRKKK